jgi:hypothetical protein
VWVRLPSKDFYVNHDNILRKLFSKGENSMINIRTNDEFRNAIIAQDDSGGYDPGGYVVVSDGKRYAIARFGHCSCYGTWTALSDKSGVIWDWEGSLRELLKLARNKMDPHCSIGSRKANEEDYDYCYLMSCYTQVLAWNENRRKKKQ